MDDTRTRDVLMSATRDGDCGRLEDALRKARHNLGDNDGQVLDAEDVLRRWRGLCGDAREELLAAIKERRDLPKLVEAVERAEHHTHAGLMRSDVRKAKNVVVITEEAMRAIKPALDSCDADTVNAFLKQYATVLPPEVHHEVTTLRDSYTKPHSPSYNPHRAGSQPHSPWEGASPRSIKASFQGNFKGYVDASSMRVSGVIDGRLNDISNVNNLLPQDTCPSPLGRATPATASATAGGGGVTGYEPSPRRARQGGGSLPLRTPLPPKTPDSIYFPTSAMRSASSYSASPAPYAAQQAMQTPPPARSPLPAMPAMPYSAHRSASRDAYGSAAPPSASSLRRPSFGQQTRSAAHPHTAPSPYATVPAPATPLPRRGDVAAAPSLPRTSSYRSQTSIPHGHSSKDDARNTERLRLCLLEINSRERIMRDERRSCQQILKEMVGDLSVSKTLRMPVGGAPPAASASGASASAGYFQQHTDSAYVDTVRNSITQPRMLPEEEEALRREQQERIEVRRQERRMALEDSARLLVAEAVMEHETIVRHESDAIVLILKKYELGVNQIHLLCKARHDFCSFETSLRRDLRAEEVSEWDHLEVSLSFQKQQAAYAHDRLQQLHEEGARVKTMEAKLAALLAPKIQEEFGGLRRDLCERLQSIEQSLSPQRGGGASLPGTPGGPAEGYDANSDLHRLFVSLAAAEQRAEEAELNLQQTSAALEEKRNELSEMRTARDDAAASAQQHAEQARSAELSSLQQEVDRLRGETEEIEGLRSAMEAEKRTLVETLDAEKRDLGRQLEEISLSHTSRVEEKKELLRELEEEREARKAQLQEEGERSRVLERQLVEEREARKADAERQRQHQQEQQRLIESERAAMRSELAEAQEELSKLRRGERKMPTIDQFMRGAMSMLMDEQQGRYSMLEEDFHLRHRVLLEEQKGRARAAVPEEDAQLRDRALMALHKTMELQLTEVQEPGGREDVRVSEVEAMSEIEQHPVVLRLFELITEGNGDDSETESE